MGRRRLHPDPCQEERHRSETHKDREHYKVDRVFTSIKWISHAAAQAKTETGRVEPRPEDFTPILRRG